MNDTPLSELVRTCVLIGMRYQSRVQKADDGMKPAQDERFRILTAATEDREHEIRHALEKFRALCEVIQFDEQGEEVGT